MKNTAVLCLVAVLLGWGSTRPAQGQPADTLLTTGQVLHRFVDAQAVAVDPQGRIYVADAGPNVVYRLSPLGEEQAALGGTGTEAGQFDEPKAIDPTNGLVVFVADAGNGRIQQFSRNDLFLSALPVPRITPGAGGAQRASFRAAEVEVAAGEEGRPIDVAVSDAGDRYVLEAETGQVLRWDFNGRLVASFGQTFRADPPLAGPVALALLGETVFVADQATAVLHRFDGFGTYLGTWKLPDLSPVQDLWAERAGLMVLQEDRIIWLNPEGDLTQRWLLDFGEPIRGLAASDTALYLLTMTRLYRFAR